MAKVSRREFLVGSGVVAAGTAALGLAGCEKDVPVVKPEVVWDYEADVIVCGTGPAGLACAAAAAEGGVTVIAIDANKYIGGKGILAGGNTGIGGGTRMQNAENMVESEKIIIEDRRLFNLRDDGKTMDVRTIDGRTYKMPQWRRISGAEDGEGLSEAFARESLPTWNWLDKMNVPFIKANVSQMAAVYRGSRFYTTTSAKLVDRENGKEGDMVAGGAGLCWPIYDTAVDNGAEFILNCKMTKIIREDGPQEGRVIGIEAEFEGKTVLMKANKAVFLGTGSWKGSYELKQLFLPWLTKYPHISGEPYVWNDGEGVQAAIAAGASIATDRGNDWHGWHRHPGTLWHSISPPFGLRGVADPDTGRCIFVNAEGKRFMDEEIGEHSPSWVGGAHEFHFQQVCAGETCDEHGPVVWIIMDDQAREAQKYDFKVGTIVEANMYTTASTIEGLGAGMGGVPIANVVAAVKRYNELVDAGSDKDFHKTEMKQKIEKPPFHAIKWGNQKHNTLGGVYINDKAQVCDWRLKPIPGFYAAGESAGNMDLIGLAKPIVFGRIAGMVIAREE